MSRLKSKKQWLHPVAITKELEFAINETTPTIALVGVVSSKENPKSLNSVHLCISVDDAARIEKKLASLAKTKKKIAQLKNELKDAVHQTAQLKKEKHKLDMQVMDLESDRDSLQHNLDILAKNINDKELMISSAMDKRGSRPTGLGKLSDRGAVGKALQGGLPGLGKRK